MLRVHTVRVVYQRLPSFAHTGIVLSNGMMLAEPGPCAVVRIGIFHGPNLTSVGPERVSEGLGLF